MLMQPTTPLSPADEISRFHKKNGTISSLNFDLLRPQYNRDEINSRSSFVHSSLKMENQNPFIGLKESKTPINLKMPVTNNPSFIWIDPTIKINFNPIHTSNKHQHNSSVLLKEVPKIKNRVHSYSTETKMGLTKSNPNKTNQDSYFVIENPICLVF